MNFSILHFLMEHDYVAWVKLAQPWPMMSLHCFSFYRHGFLLDCIGEWYEMTMGGGVRLFRHFDADFSIIYSPEGFLGATGVRHRQWRLNFAFTGIGKFNKRDLAWWEE